MSEKGLTLRDMWPQRGYERRLKAAMGDHTLFDPLLEDGEHDLRRRAVHRFDCPHTKKRINFSKSIHRAGLPRPLNAQGHHGKRQYCINKDTGAVLHPSSECPEIDYDKRIALGSTQGGLLTTPTCGRVGQICRNTMTDKNGTNDSHSGEIDTIESPVRYLAYLARLRTVVTAQSRLLAYTSVIGDVGYEAYKAKNHGATELDLARVVLERGTFQSLASMALPAFTVHTVVHQSSRLISSWPKSALTRFGPTGLGLAVIPILPTLFDHPVERAVESAFEMVWPASETLKNATKHGKKHD
ncbi:hypothetical protein HK101_002813 [Irineochytrium annulatum]|nr:hypothetical protein HK101_002813 [Irineochytrium annulatum]